MDANSQPITPPPMTTRRGGTWSISSRPVESTQRGWSMPSIGGRSGREPEAMTACLKVTDSPPSTCERVGAREPAAPLDDRDAVGLQQPAEARHGAVDDLLLVGLHLRPVDLDARHLDAQLGERGVRVLDGVRALHQGLRGDAADVQAGAAEAPLLDHGHGQAELAGADRGRVSARSAAENGDVDVHEKGFSLGVVAPGETGSGESTPGRASDLRPARYNRVHADAG